MPRFFRLSRPLSPRPFFLLCLTFYALFHLPSAAHAQVVHGPALPPAHGHAPPAEVRALTLEDCIQTALGNQPSLRAAYASLGAAQVQQQALNKMVFATVLAPDLPIRRKQSAIGVTIAQAEVSKIEWETIYGVTRNYFSAIYAQKQRDLLKDTVEKLRVYHKTTKTQVDLGNPDFSQSDVDTLAVYIGIASARQIQAEQGVKRALAALREAMGVGPDCEIVLAEADLPPLSEELSREALIDLALSRRGEMVQAAGAARITCLEIAAQDAQRQLVAPTFASGSDIHAKEVPQGIANGEYRPAAVGIEMPVNLVGRKPDRVQRAREFHARAVAVVDKTRNLIALEAEDSFLKWQEAARKVKTLNGLREKASGVVKTTEASYNLGKTKIDVLLRAQGLEAQVRADYNEALYQQALALAALERITAGGFVPVYRRPAVVVHP